VSDGTDEQEIPEHAPAPGGPPRRRAGDHEDPILQLLKPDSIRRVELLGRVARELESPLDEARENIQRVRRLEEALGPEIRTCLDDASGSLDYLAGVIGDMLDLVRIDAGVGIQIDFQAGRLESLIDEVSMLARTRCQQAGLTLACEVPAEVPAVLMEPMRIRQVLVNLIGNAIKFTPRGGRIEVDVVPEGAASVRVRVRDTGAGIAQGEQPWVFRPFWQGEAGSRCASRGSGLGLTIVREIVERHRGEVAVESEVGEGATFSFTLPIVSPETILETVIVPSVDALPRRQGALSVISVQRAQDATAGEGAWVAAIRQKLRKSDRVLHLDDDVVVIVAPSCLRATRAIVRRIEEALGEVGMDETSYWTGSVTYPSPGVSRAQFLGRTRRLLARSASDATAHA
jgi:hypothetical protein